MIHWRRLGQSDSAPGSKARDNAVDDRPRYADDDASYDEKQNEIQGIVHMNPSLELTSHNQQAPVRGEVFSKVR